MDNWLRPSQSSPVPVSARAYDVDGFLLSSAAGLAAFLQQHPAFTDQPPPSSRGSREDCRGYHGLDLWNLRHRLTQQGQPSLKEILGGIQVLIDVSGRRDIYLLPRATRLHEQNRASPTQATPQEVERAQQATTTVLLIQRCGLDEAVGHWAIAIHHRPNNCLFSFDPVSQSNHHHEALQEIAAALMPGNNMPCHVYEVPITRQTYMWAGGILVLECIRRFLASPSWALDEVHTTMLSAHDIEGLDWTHQEPYLTEMTDAELREVGALSYWTEFLSQTLGTIPHTRAASPPNIVGQNKAGTLVAEAVIQSKRIQESPQGSHTRENTDTSSVVTEEAPEPEDPAVLLFQEWTSTVGCTQREHEDDHQSHLAKAEKARGTAPACASLLDVAERLEGRVSNEHTGGTYLPAVLDPAHDLLRPGNRKDRESMAGPTQHSKSCKSAMEGIAEDDQVPPYLCLHSHYQSKEPEDEEGELKPILSTYDVDSLCSFPTSPAVARRGLQWYTQPHVTLNQVENVHLSIPIPEAARGTDGVEMQPLHNVPNYCFGRVIGLADTFIWIFFPALFRMPVTEPYSQTAIPRDVFRHWYDEVIMPSMEAVIDDNNILQYIPKTHAIATSDCSAPQESLVAHAISQEEEAEILEDDFGAAGAKRSRPGASVPGARRKHFYVTLQSRYLASLWTEVQSRAAPYQEYSGMRLYMAAKNTKLTWMRPRLEGMLEEWHRDWEQAVDESYLSPESTYIDIGRQYTPSEKGPQGRVLLWRRCCLDKLWRRRLQWSRVQDRRSLQEAIKGRKAQIYRTTYPFVTLRDARGMTVTPRPGSWELKSGLVYSQFYDLIKVPFDAAKQYPFQNRHTESMSLDPSYLRDQHNSTRGIHAHQSRVQCAYRLSKLRIHRNIPAGEGGPSATEPTSHQFTYGIRGEDRVSLVLLRRIIALFAADPPVQQPEREEDVVDRPFFTIPSATMARFLRASVNRYCFLFEHIKSQTGLKYSLPETITMAVALRGLRFSYDSSLIGSESVLWSDRWTSTRRTTTQSGETEATEVQREGLGLAKTSGLYGFGWWLPGKFDWNIWRFHTEVGDRLAVGNDLLRQDYKRQWQVLKDIRDIHIRMWQAQSWVDRFSVMERGAAKSVWLEYLHSTVLELFQRDVWRAALKSTKWKTGSDITDEAATRHPDNNPPDFCFDGLQYLFHDRQRDVSHTRPHFVIGNKLRSTEVMDLFEDLFSHSALHSAVKERKGWYSLPFRVATRRSLELITFYFGVGEATRWYRDLSKLVFLTQWVLPWPSANELISTTKESRAGGLKRRLTWASIVYTGIAERKPFDCKNPELTVPQRKLEDADVRISTQGSLSQALAPICHERFGRVGWETSDNNANSQYYWSTSDLIKSSRRCVHLGALQLGRAVEPYAQGSLYPVVEVGRPPRLRLVHAIHKKTLDELEAIFSTTLDTEHARRAREAEIVRARTAGLLSSTESKRSSMSHTSSSQYQGRSATASVAGSAYSAEARERHMRKLMEDDGSMSDESEETAYSIPTTESTGSWQPHKRLRRHIKQEQ